MPLPTVCCFGNSGAAVLRVALPPGVTPATNLSSRQLTLLCGIAASTSKELQHAVLRLISVHTLKAGGSSKVRRRTLAERVLGASDGVLVTAAQGLPFPQKELVPISLPCALTEPTIESPAFSVKIHAELVLKVPAYCFNPCVVLPLKVASGDVSAMTMTSFPLGGAYAIPPLPHMHTQPYGDGATPLSGAGAMPIVAMPVVEPNESQGCGPQSYDMSKADGDPAVYDVGSEAPSGNLQPQEPQPRQIVVGTTDIDGSVP